MMFYVYLLLGMLMVLLSILFRLASVFRLTIPLAYALIVPTLFHSWYESHQLLGNIIGYVLLGLVVLSWIITLARKIRQIVDMRREDKYYEAVLRQRLRENREHGTQEPDGGYKVQVDDLWQDDD